MGQISTKTIKLEMDEAVDATIHLTKDGPVPIEVEIQLEVDGYPVAWGNVRHNFVRVFESGRYREEWRVLQTFLKTEYFNELKIIITQWKNEAG